MGLNKETTNKLNNKLEEVKRQHNSTSITSTDSLTKAKIEMNTHTTQDIDIDNDLVLATEQSEDNMAMQRKYTYIIDGNVV